jgi:hypothetical protein
LITGYISICVHAYRATLPIEKPEVEEVQYGDIICGLSVTASRLAFPIRISDISGSAIGYPDLSLVWFSSVPIAKLWERIIKYVMKSWFSGLLHRVVRWSRTKVSEAMLPPFSGFRFVIMEA